MSEDWPTKPLQEVINIQSGFAFKSDDYTETGHFLIRIGNVQDGYISLENPKYVALDKKTVSFELKKGDILTSLTGNIGRVAEVKREHLPAALNQRVARLSVKSESNFDKNYLLFFLFSDFFRISLSSSGHGAAQQNVSLSAIGEILIPLPPLAEQRRIVAILDEAFAGIAAATANAEKNLTNARELFKGGLETVFSHPRVGWIDERLDQLGQLQTGTTPTTSDAGNSGSYIPFIKPGDFRKDGSLNYENEGLSAAGLNSSRLIKKGSALMVCIGATIGKAAYTEMDISANQQINAITPRNGVVAKFLYYQMISERFQNEVVANAGQTTLPIINKSKWGRLSIHLPPEHVEQVLIASKLDKLSLLTSQLENVYQLRLRKLAELKQAVLQKAFSGELTALPKHALQDAAE